MENLNTIPKTGSYGTGVDLHNDNYQKIGLKLETLENMSFNEKGYFETLTALEAKYPTPQSGWQAYVKDAGSSTGYYVANVNSSGDWVVTGAEAPSVGANLNDYALNGGSEKTVKDVEDEIVQLAGEINYFPSTYQASQIGKFVISINPTKEIGIPFKVVAGIEYKTDFKILNGTSFSGVIRIYANGEMVAAENLGKVITSPKDGVCVIYSGVASVATEVEISIFVVDKLIKRSELNDVKNKISHFVEKYDYSILTIPGFIRENGSESDSSMYLKTDYLPIEDISNIKIRSNILSESVVTIAFYDEVFRFITSKSQAIGIADEIYDIPLSAYWYRCCSKSEFHEFKIEEPEISLINENVIDEKIEDATTIHLLKYKESDVFSNIGFMRPDGSTGELSRYRYSDRLDISGVSKLYVHATIESVSVSPAVFFDKDGVFISGTTGIPGQTDYEINVPDDASSVVMSIEYANISSFKLDVDIALKYANISARDSDITVKDAKCFIAPTGNDDNDGLTINSPVATVARAYEIIGSNGELIFTNGDYYDLSFDLSLFEKVTGLENVRLIGGTRFESATKVDGYNRVFQVQYSTVIKTSVYLFQHDIPDEETIILDSERHPFHRGIRNRVPSTRIYHASSIEEIENTTDVLMWYQEDGVLYFSKVEGSNLAVNPVVLPSGVFSASSNRSVEIRNLNLYYYILYTRRLSGLLENIRVGMCSGAGAVVYDESIGLLFRKCEAYACFNDGFNGHSSEPRTSVVFEDCWGHDNYDDGESCHGYSDITHKGGLYEYNGNGITPASGGHATCYDVIVRRSGGHRWSDITGTGFSAQGNSLDGGIGTNIHCFGCLSENNKIGFIGLYDQGSKAINCISRADENSFENSIEQINCVTI